MNIYTYISENSNVMLFLQNVILIWYYNSIILKYILIYYNYIYIYILSNISYGTEIWANNYKSNINIILLLQKKIIRIIKKNLKFKSIILNNIIKYA